MHRIATMSGLLVVLSLVVGCTTERTAAPAKPADSASAGDDSPTKEDAALAQLSEEDRSLALTQKVCPVSGEPLGSMGTPIKVTKGDRALFVCCKGCEEDALKRFDELYEQVHAGHAEVADE